MILDELHSKILDRFNRCHYIHQRRYSPSWYPPTQTKPENHALYLISRYREQKIFLTNMINTDNIHVSHHELDLLGEMYVGTGWKHDIGYQIQVIFHGDNIHLSSAKIGYSIQHSLERNYESLLRLIHRRKDIPLYPEGENGIENVHKKMKN